MKYLRNLDLGDCLIRDQGAFPIIEALRSIQTLEKLNISFNELKIDVAMAAIKMGASIKLFKSLNIDGNLFGDEGIETIESELELLDKPFIISYEDDEGDMQDSTPIESENEEDLSEMIAKMRI
ncbi:hypothetical protein MXB_4512 [Myxobolus squamalis]|nr:hypothetical protein MXB_4512 [Myxobolus squamalis]